jgi:multidrug efflux pump subunit AcrB
VISLAGVAFSIGMTLDNNIVLLENIYRHLGRGEQRLQAALAGVTEVWPAVLALTLTTVAVFLPVIFIEEEAGQLYSDIAIAISASILMSMLVAIALVPAATGRLLRVRPVKGREPLLVRVGQGFSRAVIGGVHWIVQGWLRSLGTILMVLAGAWLVIYFLTPWAEYLPQGEEAKIFTLMFAPPGYNIHMMREAFREVDRHFTPAVGQDPDAFEQGETSVPALNFTIGFETESRVFVVREATDRRRTEALMQVAAKKTAELPGLRRLSSRGSIFSGNFGVRVASTSRSAPPGCRPSSPPPSRCSTRPSRASTSLG